MNIATLYRKEGKVILETDNDAVAQVATDTPQDVVVVDAYERTAVHYLAGERQAGRPASLAAPYGQNVPPHGMAGIDEVRERLERDAADPAIPYTVVCAGSDLRALLADHARLRADAERLDWLEDFVRLAYLLGASFDFARSCEGEPGGFRFMTRHRIDARQPTLRAAIDAAKAVQP